MDPSGACFARSRAASSACFISAASFPERGSASRAACSTRPDSTNFFVALLYWREAS
jgi:hypothetical protein